MTPVYTPQQSFIRIYSKFFELSVANTTKIINFLVKVIKVDQI